ncbi:MFS transporter [Rhodococcus sp. B10]|uniref:MFS transporter n=1 Tax=Rhodococcus sp. B10 TaxID=2695876 RepID=UPI0016B103BC|nr:Proline/betaine transporter [Rhodococcus sp. B10]
MTTKIQDGTSSSRSGPVRSGMAALIGTTIEFYEFGIYGLLAPTIAPLFFPDADPTAALLATFLLFAIAFAIRPIGGIVLGRIGDATGRKNVLMATIVGMGIATAAIGLLPTYVQIGVLAPVLLLVCRLVQGFFTGGEQVGASTYVTESVQDGKRGFYGAFMPTGVALGLGSASLVTGITSSLTTDAQMSDWGWRVPFLVSVPLIVVAILIRRHITESEEYLELAASGHRETSPVRETFRSHRGALARVVLIGYGQNVGYWVGITFMSTFLIKFQGYSQSSVLWLVTFTTLGLAICMPLWGLLSDRIGRKPILLGGFLGYAILSFPMMSLMTRENFALAATAFVVLALPFPMVQSMCYSIYTEQFPAPVRYTGMAISYNFATIIGAGLSPYLATLLISSTGWDLAPSMLLTAGAVVSLVTLGVFTAVSPGTRKAEASNSLPTALPESADATTRQD